MGINVVALPFAIGVCRGVPSLPLVIPYLIQTTCAGLMKQFMTATFTDLLLRVAFAFILSKSFGASGIWFAWSAGWVIAAVMSVIFYIKGPWKRKTKKLILYSD